MVTVKFIMKHGAPPISYLLERDYASEIISWFSEKKSKNLTLKWENGKMAIFRWDNISYIVVE